MGVLVALKVACTSHDATVDTEPCGRIPRTSESLVSSAQQFKGASLPDKTLALTFDDGPGNRTQELSSYLRDEGIFAAFFVIGRNMVGREATVAKVVADGHVVGNHTQNHYDLTTQSSATVLSELRSADTLLAPYLQGTYIFRAPRGKWNAADFAAVQSSPMNKYVGPINWSVGGTLNLPASAADWACWRNSPQRTTKECADGYLSEIGRVRHGIVLMHDPYGWANGNTIDMVKYLVPILKSQGYSFVRLDDVPEIRSVLGPKSVVSLHSGGAAPPTSTQDPPGEIYPFDGESDDAPPPAASHAAPDASACP